MAGCFASCEARMPSPQGFTRGGTAQTSVRAELLHAQRPARSTLARRTGAILSRDRTGLAPGASKVAALAGRFTEEQPLDPKASLFADPSAGEPPEQAAEAVSPGTQGPTRLPLPRRAVHLVEGARPFAFSTGGPWPIGGLAGFRGFRSESCFSSKAAVTAYVLPG
jgi:hypothetical protein